MSTNVYKTPDSNLTDESNLNQSVGLLASRWQRLGAAIIDGLIAMPASLGLMYVMGIFDSITSGTPLSLFETLVLLGSGIVTFIVLHGYFLIKNGQTIGKKVLSIKIVTTEHRPATVNNLLRRYGIFFILPQIPVAGVFINLINICFIFGKNKQCLHDLGGQTLVVVC